jgi:formyltetrahydrofolate-dependent phosphoribosylglycinamide formyltransferase
MTARVAVLASGGGSNLQAILDYFDAQGADRAVEIALVASDRASAGALDRARQRQVPAVAMDATQRMAGLTSLLESHRVDYVALAGYLRFVPDAVTRQWRGRIVNIHPSLLPAFGGDGMYGIRVHTAALDAGVRVTGATVHFVDEVYDRGAIIAQRPVPVLPDDTPASLTARVQAVEHRLLPAAVELYALGRLKVEGRRVLIRP